MLKYADSRESSAELLRLALPLMSQQPAALNPQSYAVWYEYVSRRNTPLREAIDRALGEGKLLDDTAIEALHDRFIAGREAAAATRMQTAMERVIAELGRQVAAAGAQADQYSASLGECNQNLKSGVDAQTLEGMVKSLLEATERMHDSTSTLGGRLRAGTEEVEQLRADLARARGEARTDPLTGVSNRRGLEQALGEGQNATRALEGACLIVLDIDHFKRCNDTYGHLFGDRVIRAVAQVALKLVKGQDTVARIGGEEFAVLLPATRFEDACTLGERIRATVRDGRIKRMETGEMVGNITVSLGVAAHRAGEDFESLMQRADAALYASKRGGRNRLSVAAEAVAGPRLDAAA